MDTKILHHPIFLTSAQLWPAAVKLSIGHKNVREGGKGKGQAWKEAPTCYLGLRTSPVGLSPS